MSDERWVKALALGLHLEPFARYYDFLLEAWSAGTDYVRVTRLGFLFLLITHYSLLFTGCHV